MSSSAIEVRPPRAQRVTVTDDSLTVDLVDGRTVSVPLAWYPRLTHGTPSERDNWRLIGQGEGVHWPGSSFSAISFERDDVAFASYLFFRRSSFFFGSFFSKAMSSAFSKIAAIRF